MGSKTWCRVDSIMFLEVSFPLKSLETPTLPLRWRAFGLMEFTAVIFNALLPGFTSYLIKQELRIFLE